ncbi:ATP-binding protein [Streptomyces sp. NPDC055966]|uniref:ATP-binding protein n=1 Tax=Streptomyces sp. NPDC055966 TaxID=3345669 RepID=UPI0035D9161E
MLAGESAEGLRLADEVDVSRLPSRERQFTFTLELARCYVLRRDDAAVLVHLLDLEKLSPQDMVRSKLGTDMVLGLLDRVRPTYRRQVLGLAERLAVGRSAAHKPTWDTLPQRKSDCAPRWRAMMAEDGAPVMSTCLPRVGASVPIARRLVREALVDWDLPDLADAAELVVSELASNAVRHTRHWGLRLTILRLAGRGVRVAVTDKSRVLPVKVTSCAENVTGRGLALVDAVSQEWGTVRLSWGKRIWADGAAADVLADISPALEVRVFATPTAQIIYVLLVVALAAWLGVLIVGG